IVLVHCISSSSRHPRTTLCPYTTLFRSDERYRLPTHERIDRALGQGTSPAHQDPAGPARRPRRRPGHQPHRRYHQPHGRMGQSRSEEHTSELQSRENLVCGLLLEKKKIYTAFDSSEVSVQRVYEYVSILELRVKPVACGLQTYALGAVEYTLQVES